MIFNSLLTPHAKGVIYDTRSETTAASARAKGKIYKFLLKLFLILGGGKEQRYHYSQWHYVHGNLPRIREFKESLTKLIEGYYFIQNWKILAVFSVH